MFFLSATPPREQVGSWRVPPTRRALFLFSGSLDRDGERERETERGGERPSVFLNVEYVMHETLGLPDGWFVVFVQLLLSTIGRKKLPLNENRPHFCTYIIS